jgi:hypothetical protein
MLTPIKIDQLSLVTGGQVFPRGGPPSNDLHGVSTGERLSFGRRGNNTDWFHTAGFNRPLHLAYRVLFSPEEGLFGFRQPPTAR